MGLCQQYFSLPEISNIRSGNIAVPSYILNVMPRFRETLAWTAIIGASLIPVIIWLSLDPLRFRFATPSVTATSVGQLSGLVGMVLFATSLILSARIPLFDRWFGGINRAYIIHHQIGAISLVLLLIHPLSLAVTRIFESWAAAAFFLLPGSDWTINFGISALLILISLLVITLYIDLPYELWRFTHKYLGVAFAFAILHTYFIPSDVSRNLILRIYMLTITGLALTAYMYRTVLGRFFVPRLRYNVKEVRHLTANVFELLLVPSGSRNLNFIPGQFVFMSLSGRSMKHETHPFSISSAPDPNGFILTVKALGDYSAWLSGVNPTTEVLIEGPYGRFSYLYEENSSYLWIAGGIGITPFVSMARSVSTTGSAVIDLFYCVRDPSEAVYSDELNNIASQNPKFHVYLWCSKQSGRLSADAIARTCGDIHDKEAYICGPPAMMMDMRKQLRRLNLPAKQIHTEEFTML